MKQEIKETAAVGSVGAHSIATNPGRFGAKPTTRTLKGFLVNYYNKIGNKLNLFPVNLYKLGLDKKVKKVVSNVNEGFNLDSVLAQLSSYENKNSVKDEEVTAYGVEDDKGNLMKVTVLNTEADDFEAYISAYLSELKDFENQGVDLDDISLAELLYKLKDIFDIRDVEFPNIPEDIVYNADEATKSIENSDNMPDDGMGGGMDDIEGDDNIEGEMGMGGPQDFGGEGGTDDMDSELGMGDEFGDEEGMGDEFGDEEGMGDELGDDESVEDFEDFDEDEGSTSSILLGIIDMLKAQAEATKAEAEAAAEQARADQAEATARAAEVTLSNKEEMMAMDAEKNYQKDEEKAAKRLADLATYRYKKSRGMMDQPDAKFEGFDDNSLLMDVMLNEMDIVSDPNMVRRNHMLEVRQLEDLIRNAESEEERVALQQELQVMKRALPLKRQQAMARQKRQDAQIKNNNEETGDPNDPNANKLDPKAKKQVQDVLNQMFETETISNDEYELLDESAKRLFKRYGNKFVRKFRCYGGPKDGKMVSTAAGCGMRKDPFKVRQGKKSARMKKGQRVRKTQMAKRKAPSKRLVRLNKILLGMKGFDPKDKE